MSRRNEIITICFACFVSANLWAFTTTSFDKPGKKDKKQQREIRKKQKQNSKKRIQSSTIHEHEEVPTDDRLKVFYFY